MGTSKIKHVWLVEYESGEYSDHVQGIVSIHGTEEGAQLKLAEIEGLRENRRNWKCNHCGRGGRTSYDQYTRTHCLNHNYPQKDVWLQDEYFISPVEVLWP